MIEVDNFSFSYDTFESPVLHNLSFTLAKGETLLMLGPSGSGKSTLALCLNGLYPTAIDGFTEGSIYLFGKKIEEYLPGEVSQHIGVVFQDPEAQFCMLTVEDEIAFGLENLKIPRSEIAERIKWALSLVGLQDYVFANISTLSGGMKQKLALACVLAMKPNMIILDEPTAMLDPITTREFAQTIKKLQAELHFSLIVIEHKLDHWVPFTDRCLVFSEAGNILFDGPPRDCFENYLEVLEEQGVFLPKTIALSEQLGFANSASLTENELLEMLVEGNFSPEDLPLFTLNKDIHLAEPILKTNAVTYIKNDKTILKNMNLSIPQAALTAIVGPNGAGKSTLSYILSGLVKPSNGEILYKSNSLSLMSDFEKSKTIGYVFQNPEHQFVADTVYEEIAFSLKMQKINEEEIRTIVERILLACRLQELSNQHPFSLSQGQKRRLSVATMMVDEQPLLILDEPTYGQDAKTASELMNMISNRLAAGYSALMITHDMELVSEYADHVIVIVDGEVLFQGTPHQLFSEHDDLLRCANLEMPLSYSLQKKLTLRGENFAAAHP